MLGIVMRRAAKSYSIIDHEILHGGYLGRLSTEALALYLFLTVVGDGYGKSFYADFTVEMILRFNAVQLDLARKDLIQEGLIKYQKPYWIVKELTLPAGVHDRKAANCVAPLVKQILGGSSINARSRNTS
jgi:hypothetical protein